MAGMFVMTGEAWRRRVGVDEVGVRGDGVVQLIGLRFVVAQQTAIASTNPAKMLVWDY